MVAEYRVDHQYIAKHCKLFHEPTVLDIKFCIVRKIKMLIDEFVGPTGKIRGMVHVQWWQNIEWTTNTLPSIANFFMSLQY